MIVCPLNGLLWAAWSWPLWSGGHSLGPHCLQDVGTSVGGRAGVLRRCLKESKAGRCSETSSFETCKERSFFLFLQIQERGFYFKEGFIV